MIRYIYKVTNLVNHKSYIGQHTTNNLYDGYLGSGTYIRRAVKKYGSNKFTLSVLEFCETQEQLDERERYWIAHYKSIGKAEYNIAKGGEGGYILKYAPEERKKEVYRKISEGNKHKTPWNKGKKLLLSEEMHNKLSEAHKNISEETRKKMSEAKKGRHWSEETKKKSSNSHKGHISSEETRKNISEALKGHYVSEETKKKISEYHKGKHWYNNGKYCVQAKECPEGFVSGRILRRI